MSAARRRTGVGFTLVELLVVMVIIGMLALIGTRVAFSVFETAKVARITLEVDSLAAAMKVYKIDFGSYPPLLSDKAAVKKHVRRRWPNHRYNDGELPSADSNNVNSAAAESLVFWLGSFNTDPEYPFRPTDNNNNNTSGVGQKTAPRFDFDEQRLFNEINGERQKRPREANNIKYWRYYPAGLQKPYIYFESRSYENAGYGDSDNDNNKLKPYVRSDNEGNPNSDVREYVEPDGFQIICAGLDDEFGAGTGRFPRGPYDKDSNGRDRGFGDDNITSFSGRTLADAKP